MKRESSTCQAPGCDRAARKGNQGSRYCEAHYKRLQRGQPLAAPVGLRISHEKALLTQVMVALAQARVSRWAEDEAACRMLRLDAEAILREALR
jgi:hypothetical protein